MNAVIDNLASLSAREMQVFDHIARGVKPTTTAVELGLSVKTVSTYRARVVEKLGVKSNAELARLHAEAALAAGADHTLLAAAMCAGICAWHPSATGATGEVDVNGLRYWTTLDDAGVPALTDSLRLAITDAIARRRAGVTP